MKFTSEDLLKAMGLKDSNYITFEDDTRLFEVVQEEKELYLVCDFKKFNFFNKTLNKNFVIIQPKPTLTEDEKVILRNLNKRYKYINREEYGGLRVSETKPIYSKSMKEYYYSGFDTFIYDNLFQFIKWEDEPYSIEELLKE